MNTAAIKRFTTYKDSWLAILILVLAASSFLSFFLPTPALATSDREAQISQSGKLRVCIWPDYFAISYLNRKTSLFEGIDISLSQELAKELAVEVEYISTDYTNLMQDVAADKCDLGMTGVGITPERTPWVDFSDAYLSSGKYGITNRSNQQINTWEDIDQTGVIVCVQENTFMARRTLARLEKASVIQVATNNTCELEVRSGRADVFITDYPYSHKILQVYDWAKLLTPKIATAKIDYAYPIKKGQPKWLARINQFVASIKTDGRLKNYASENGLLPIALVD